MMKFIILSFSCLIAFLFADNAPLDGFKVTVKDLAVAGKTVRISPFKGIGVVTINLCFKNAGQKLAPKAKECLVSLLQRAMGESTESKTSDQIQAYSREHNVHVSFGGSDDNFTITGKCPADKLTQLFALIKEMLFHASFSDKDLNRFKNETAASIQQSMQSPNAQLNELVKATILKEHPYGILQKTYLSSLKNISTHDLKNHIKTYFTQENLIISACGDIDEELLVAHLTDLITALPKVFKASMPVNASVVGPYEKHSQKFPVPQTVIQLVHEGIDAHHPDFFALNIAIGCLCNPNMGVLWKKIRSEKGLTYDIRGGFSMQEHCNTLNIATFTQTKSVEQALEAIKEVIADIHENGFSHDLVETVKKNFLGNYKRSFSSTGQIATRLMNYQLNNRPIDFHNILVEKIAALTVEDVNQAFKKFLKPNQFVTFTVGQ